MEPIKSRKKIPRNARSLAGRCIEDFAAFPVPLCPARRADAQGKKDRLLNRDPRKNLVLGSKFWILSMCLEVETKTLQFCKQPCW